MTTNGHGLAARLDRLTRAWPSDEPPEWLRRLEEEASEPPEETPIVRAALQMARRRHLAETGREPIRGRMEADAWDDRLAAEFAALAALVTRHGGEAGLAAWPAAGSALPPLGGWPVDLVAGYAADLAYSQRRQQDLVDAVARWRERRATMGRWGY